MKIVKSSIRKLCCIKGCKNVGQPDCRGMCISHYKKSKKKRKFTHWQIADYVNVAIGYSRGDDVNHIAENNNMTKIEVRYLVGQLKKIGIKINRKYYVSK